MRLLKKINNNFALALDSKGKQMIVEGRGVGFQKMPAELTDLSLIRRTYYDATEQDVNLLRSIPEDILDICGEITQYAEGLIADKLNPNLTFILADHIQFSVERYEKKMDIKMPLYYDIIHLYPRETKVAEYALRLVRERLGICLPDSELTGIALNIINSELTFGEKREDKEEVVEQITRFIEKSCAIHIRRNSFSYSRFVSHMEYLLKRAGKKQTASEENMKLYRTVKMEVPQINQCVNGIELLLKEYHYHLNEEEKLYLMLHVNRLCDREGL